MAQVAQAYFHFETALSAQELRRFGRKVRKASREAALRNFNIEVQIVVDIEEGSLVGRITAIGAIILSTTSLISNYKGVKDSLNEICQDARSFGGDVCQRAIDYAGVSKRQVVRIERRTRTTGKLGRLLKDVERLEKSVDELSPSQMKGELSRFNHELEKIAKDLEPEERQALEELLEKTKLPAPRDWPEQVLQPPKAVMEQQQIELMPEEDPGRRKRRPMRYHTSFKVKPKKSRKKTRSLLDKDTGGRRTGRN